MLREVRNTYAFTSSVVQQWPHAYAAMEQLIENRIRSRSSLTSSSTIHRTTCGLIAPSLGIMGGSGSGMGSGAGGGPGDGPGGPGGSGLGFWQWCVNWSTVQFGRISFSCWVQHEMHAFAPSVFQFGQYCVISFSQPVYPCDETSKAMASTTQTPERHFNMVWPTNWIDRLKSKKNDSLAI